MTQALSSPTRDPHQCLDGYAELVGRLTRVFYVQIIHTDAGVPAHNVGLFDGPNRVLRIRGDAAIEDQVWLMAKVWFLLTMGPWAVPEARPEPHLRLIPTQRPTCD